MTKPVYINWAFENGSPMDWEENPEGTVVFQPLFDYERGSRNRQLTHWHFKLSGTKGQILRLRIPPKDNIYGGRNGNAFPVPVGAQMSGDGVNWTPMIFQTMPDKSIETTVTLPADEVFFARIEPYTTRHLAELLERIKDNPRVKIETIGETVEGRPLEMITLSAGPGRKSALIRGRAHPWEAGGNWFIDGIVEQALSDPAILAELDIHILPMTCKDGVVRGLTRFNVNGCDLNRGFAKGLTFSREGAIENFHLVQWLDARKTEEALPCFAMDLHDDDNGNLHFNAGADAAHLGRMHILEKLMREGTYFSEGIEKGSAPTFGYGLLELYGIDSIVYELNSNWLNATRGVPDSKVWRQFGSQFAEVLRKFFAEVYKR